MFLSKIFILQSNSRTELHRLSAQNVPQNTIRKSATAHYQVVTLKFYDSFRNLPDAVFGEFDAGEDVGVVLTGSNPGTVAAAVDVTLNDISQDEHHGHLNP